ncbi:MAG: UDP-glucose/GDP-mannose dehydrogenase family protein [Methanomicrobiales archaeon]
MKISIIGCGYVGAVTGACFAELGNEVCFIDVDVLKIKEIESHRSPIFEPGLDSLLEENAPRISTSTSIREGIIGSDCSFICVGTPSNEDGSIDLTYIKSAAEEIGNALRTMENHTVVVKSTVVPGTTDNVIIPLLEKNSLKCVERGFHVAMNPEFLKEGSALNDFFHPDRIIMGVMDDPGNKVLEELYRSFSCQKLCTSIKIAEMIKYVSNAFLATKISFSNEIGNICKKLDIDVYEVMKGVGLDQRIGPKFLNAGAGFGGSCFPKDVSALIALAEKYGESPILLKSAIEINEKQPGRLVELLRSRVGELKNKRITILGLAFKDNTDDIRDSRAIPVIKELLVQGADIAAYDPMACGAMKKIFPSITYCRSAAEALNEADGCLVMTEWPEFAELHHEFDRMRKKIIIEGRRILSCEGYEGICW